MFIAASCTNYKEEIPGIENDQPSKDSGCVIQYNKEIFTYTKSLPAMHDQRKSQALHYIAYNNS